MGVCSPWTDHSALSYIEFELPASCVLPASYLLFAAKGAVVVGGKEEIMGDKELVGFGAIRLLFEARLEVISPDLL